MVPVRKGLTWAMVGIAWWQERAASQFATCRPGEVLRLSGAARRKKPRKWEGRRITAARVFKQDSGGELTRRQGPLADRSLSRECLRDYVQRLGSYWAYVEAAGLVISEVAEMDSSLVKWCTRLGRRKALAPKVERLRSAKKATMPDFFRRGTLNLSRLWRSLGALGSLPGFSLLITTVKMEKFQKQSL